MDENETPIDPRASDGLSRSTPVTLACILGLVAALEHDASQQTRTRGYERLGHVAIDGLHETIKMLAYEIMDDLDEIERLQQ